VDPANVLTFKEPGRSLTGSPKKEKNPIFPQNFSTFFSPVLKGLGSKFSPRVELLQRAWGVKRVPGRCP
jgi:hypothetical protein